MNKNIEIKNDKKVKNSKYDNLIAVLLIMPFYMLTFILLEFIKLSTRFNLVMFFISTYLPVIIGIILLFKFYNDKVNKTISIAILMFLILGNYFCYHTYFGKHLAWDILGFAFLWFITNGICRLLSCIIIGKIGGWKKGLIFLMMYILIVICSFQLEFLGFVEI